MDCHVAFAPRNDEFFVIASAAKQSIKQGFRIIKRICENMASGRGFVVQNRAIMRYTLFVV